MPRSEVNSCGKPAPRLLWFHSESLNLYFNLEITDIPCKPQTPELMSKGQDVKKSVKKAPAKTLKEKRLEKKEKKVQKGK